MILGYLAQFHPRVKLGHLGRVVFSALPLAVLLLATLPATRKTIARGAIRPRALVLEPFSSEYPVENAGWNETRILKLAGFNVTVLRDAAVTVDVMRQLSRYAFVYVYTHVGPLPDNDAAIATGDTHQGRYAQQFANYTLVQMHIVTNNAYHYFDAVTGQYIYRYNRTFPSHTIVFLNACTALGKPRFWYYLHHAGVSTLVSWRHHVGTADASMAAKDLFVSLAEGSTVGQAIRAMRAAGAGTSLVGRQRGVLSFAGDGTNSLLQAGRSTLYPYPLSPSRCSLDCLPPNSTSEQTAVRLIG